MPDLDQNEVAPTPATGDAQTTGATRPTTDEQTVAPAAPVRRARRTASRPVGPPPEAAAAPDPAAVTPAQAALQQPARETPPPPPPPPLAPAEVEVTSPTKATRRRRVPLAATFSAEPAELLPSAPVAPVEPSAARRQPGFVAPLFQEPDPAVAQPRRSRRRPAAAVGALGVDAPGSDAPGSSAAEADDPGSSAGKADTSAPEDAAPSEVDVEQTPRARSPRARRSRAARPVPEPVLAEQDLELLDEAIPIDSELLVEPTDELALDDDGDSDGEGDTDGDADSDEDDADDADDADRPLGAARRRRRRGGRKRRRPGSPLDSSGAADGESVEGGARDSAADPDQDRIADIHVNQDRGDVVVDADPDAAAAAEDEPETNTRRRRRRRRSGSQGDAVPEPDDPPNTVVRVRATKTAAAVPDDGDGVTAVRGSTRLEAKKQRRREGRDAGRRRPPVLTEAEFLARREAVDRRMVVRERDGRIQIAILEDKVLVEHYVDRISNATMVGNVYLGRVQNVLPSMEAAFVDVGRGRNAVLYAGEVNWDAAGLEGQPKRIEVALKSGDPVLVQVTKDPVGHKGARLTSAISLPGRFLVLVPDGSMTGISRKLPDTERTRLKSVLRRALPEGAGVIVRTAAEGASEDELAADITRLQEQWLSIEAKSKSASPPTLLHGEPDLLLRVVRDVFNEDFVELVIDGERAWQSVSEYLGGIAPELAERLTQWTADGDAFAEHRIDEQILKALDRKVWLPSGGSLVIDRTEAMTVVDVNTGRFIGSGGNLEETVTRNNLEAAEEIVRQLRLRDIGGIIVVDFIDMVLEVNRELVLRRLVECLGRDRSKHQVAEVTSLGLVQMTRKKIGTGLLEAFSEPCGNCHGRGVNVSLDQPVHSHVEVVEVAEPAETRGRRRRGSAPAEPAAEASDELVVDPAPVGPKRRRRATRPEDSTAEQPELLRVIPPHAPLHLPDGLVPAHLRSEHALELALEVASENGASEGDRAEGLVGEPVTG